MDIGILAVWLCLTVYSAIVLKTRIVEKKERKWVYGLVIVTFCFTLLVLRNISFNSFLTILDDTFGNISRMVVK